MGLDFCKHPGGCIEFAQSSDPTEADTRKYYCVKHEAAATARGETGERPRVLQMPGVHGQGSGSEPEPGAAPAGTYGKKVRHKWNDGQPQPPTPYQAPPPPEDRAPLPPRPAPKLVPIAASPGSSPTTAPVGGSVPAPPPASPSSAVPSPAPSVSSGSPALPTSGAVAPGPTPAASVAIEIENPPPAVLPVETESPKELSMRSKRAVVATNATGRESRYATVPEAAAGLHMGVARIREACDAHTAVQSRKTKEIWTLAWAEGAGATSSAGLQVRTPRGSKPRRAADISDSPAVLRGARPSAALVKSADATPLDPAIEELEVKLADLRGLREKYREVMGG